MGSFAAVTALATVTALAARSAAHLRPPAHLRSGAHLLALYDEIFWRPSAEQATGWLIHHRKPPQLSFRQYAAHGACQPFNQSNRRFSALRILILILSE
mmetsp:Transcript_68406/g.135526  ORF Transcript_68406/g.135526 Transcript_68406/m.135526 type:complete len:99 (+) Transcript_68406:296-592(+)